MRGKRLETAIVLAFVFSFSYAFVHLMMSRFPSLIPGPNYFEDKALGGALSGLSLLGLLVMGAAGLAMVFLALKARGSGGPGRRSPPARRLAAALPLLALLAALLLALLAHHSPYSPSPSGFWVAQSFFGQPSQCFGEWWHGNAAKSGPSYPALLSEFGLTAESGLEGMGAAHALLGTAAAFLLYLVAKRMYGRGPALFVLLLFVLQTLAFNPLRDMNTKDFAMQNAVSLGFVLVLLEWMEAPTPLLSGALGLIGGIGFATKLSFVQFLAAALVAAALLGRGRRRYVSLRCLAPFAAAFLLGAFPFVLFNLTHGFPSYHIVGFMLENPQPGAPRYSPLDLLGNLAERTVELARINERNGMLGWLFVALPALCAAHAALFAEGRRRTYLVIALMAAASLALFSFSYHHLQDYELEAENGLFFLAYSYPVALLAPRKGAPLWKSPLVWLLAVLAILAAQGIWQLGSVQPRPHLESLLAAEGVRDVYTTSCPSAYFAHSILPRSGLSLSWAARQDYAGILGRESGPLLFVFENGAGMEAMEWPSDDPLGENLGALRRAAEGAGRELEELSGWENDRFFRAVVAEPAAGPGN